jgi:hypothetical protein
VSPAPGTLGRIGLCTDCQFARVVESARGSAFWRCSLSEQDERFPKYPPLPVRSCPGYEPMIEVPRR